MNSYTLDNWHEDKTMIAKAITRKKFTVARDFLQTCFINAEGILVNEQLKGALFILDLLVDAEKK